LRKPVIRPKYSISAFQVSRRYLAIPTRYDSYILVNSCLCDTFKTNPLVVWLRSQRFICHNVPQQRTTTSPILCQGRLGRRRLWKPFNRGFKVSLLAFYDLQL
jgi:hypothetical protein